jgi:hypothetical protein
MEGGEQDSRLRCVYYLSYPRYLLLPPYVLKQFTATKLLRVL